MHHELHRIEQKIDRLLKLGETMHEELTAFADRIDKATTAIPTLPPDIKTRFEGIATRLEAMAKDPNNPVPPAPPVQSRK